jgi:hypothetical protein
MQFRGKRRGTDRAYPPVTTETLRLTDYQVVVVGVDDATYLDWAQRGRFVTIDGTKVTDARTLAGQIGLAKAMRRYDLHRTRGTGPVDAGGWCFRRACGRHPDGCERGLYRILQAVSYAAD